ncbi:MAG: LysE family translocator [Emcibacteraceae bacterium]|nr:LysE family translocator [Emcibacteraceae bacterium]
MNYELWITFIIASAILTLIPGPSVMLITGRALTHGTNAALLCIIGDLVAGVVLMILSFLGVGAILDTSPLLFQILKWAGVSYMIYLGISQIIAARNAATSSIENKIVSVKNNVRDGFMSALLNPKALAFYLAFLTQFIDPTGNLWLQFSILITLSTVVTGIVLLGYVFLAARTRQAFQSKSATKWFGYTGGGFLVSAGIWMASTR